MDVQVYRCILVCTCILMYRNKAKEIKISGCRIRAVFIVVCHVCANKMFWCHVAALRVEFHCIYVCVVVCLSVLHAFHQIDMVAEERLQSSSSTRASCFTCVPLACLLPHSLPPFPSLLPFSCCLSHHLSCSSLFTIIGIASLVYKYQAYSASSSSSSGESSSSSSTCESAQLSSGAAPPGDIPACCDICCFRASCAALKS